MTHKEAFRIVLRAAEANATGSDRAREIGKAIEVVSKLSGLIVQRGTIQPKLSLTRDQADRLLKALADAHVASPSPQLLACYADLAELYTAAGYDVAELEVRS